jgi:hypothetical protein
MDNQEMSEVLGRLDERTKYIKEKLDDHCHDESVEDLPKRVATIETNISWIKRLGIGVPASLSAIVAAWKGLA